MTTSISIGQSQRNKETGEPDDATSITSGSEGGWEKRQTGPRSQPTRLQRSSTTFSCVSISSFFAFKEGMHDIQTSALRGSPTVSLKQDTGGNAAKDRVRLWKDAILPSS